MAKINNKSAKTYAAPHTMSGGRVDNDVPMANNKQYMKALNVSVGNSHSNDYAGVKTDGIETRGNGAATKGRIARGPMA